MVELDGASLDVAQQGHPDDWNANPGPQARFLSLTCFEALYGGAAGGGKSDALLVDLLRGVGKGYARAYSAIAFRRTFPELQKSLILQSFEIYPRLGGRYNSGTKTWRFPAGETITFAHIQHTRDVHRYQGAAFCRIAFDELTSFEESQYLYMISRCRNAWGIPCAIRSATNPGNEGHDWVMRRFGAWLDTTPEYRGFRAALGQVVYFIPDGDDSERVVGKGTLDGKGRSALGRVFIPAKLEDNPFLYVNDPAYEQRLDMLDPVTREQLRAGNWLIKPGKGLMFRDEWFNVVDQVDPLDSVTMRCRYWDRAATQDGGDFTVGARWCRTLSGRLWVEDIVRAQLGAGGVIDLVKQTAERDGRETVVALEQDPASAGKTEIEFYTQAFNATPKDGADDLRTHSLRAFPKNADKVTAAKPASALAFQRKIYVVRGAWNREWMSEHKQFPEGAFDDQVDTTSGAVKVLGHGPAQHRVRSGATHAREILG